MASISDQKTSGDFLDFILAELKLRLVQDAWKSTEEFLQAECRKDEETGDQTTLEECSQATSWLKWAQSHKKLKVVVGHIPNGILPSGFVGTLSDVKVSARGPDDVIYDKHKELRQRVARGNCFLSLTMPDKKTVTSCVIYALKKFTGGLGDDDDRDKGDSCTWKMYFSKPLEDCRRVVCTKKANGEAAHLSAVSIGGQHYLCAGSKNVHMIFRHQADIDKYDLKENRYTVAREVSHCVLAELDSMISERRRRFIEFLAVTRLTAVFEILNPDHPHVEDLSLLPAPQLKFITWTSLDLSTPEDGKLCWLAPDTSIEIARVFGLSTVDYAVIDIAQVDDQMSKVRRYHNAEGEVLFFLDGDRNVIGMLKKKSVWYILVRAIREKVRTSLSSFAKEPLKFQLENEIKKIDTRINQIQEWLGLDEETVTTWKGLGTDFLQWTVHQVQSGGLDGTDVTTRFPVHWQKFLAENQRTDRVFVSNCVSG